jgi:hypothetical protein
MIHFALSSLDLPVESGSNHDFFNISYSTRVWQDTISSCIGFLSSPGHRRPPVHRQARTEIYHNSRELSSPEGRLCARLRNP